MCFSRMNLSLLGVLPSVDFGGPIGEISVRLRLHPFGLDPGSGRECLFRPRGRWGYDRLHYSLSLGAVRFARVFR